MSIIGPPVYRFGDLRVGSGPGKYNFSVGLVRNFVEEAMGASIDDEILGSFQDIGFNIMGRGGYSERRPFSFWGNSLLVSNFALGRDGRWLNVPISDIEYFKERRDDCLVYSSHNIDSSHDRDVLLTLFTTWVDYVPTVLDILNGK